MRDIGSAHHAAEDRAQPWVVEHLLGEDDEGVMHIVLWYSSGDAVQVSRSHAQKALSRSGLSVACVHHEDAYPRRDDDPASRLPERTGSVFSIPRLVFETLIYFSYGDSFGIADLACSIEVYSVPFGSRVSRERAFKSHCGTALNPMPQPSSRHFDALRDRPIHPIHEFY